METLIAFLDTHDIAYRRVDHPPVYTVEDVHRLVPPLPAARTKNLFLRDGPGRRHFLISVPDHKRVNLKTLTRVLDVKRLSFGSAGRLERHLGVEPGSVTLLAIVNDTAHAVETIVDRELWEADAYQFHPLVNTSTLVISRDGIRRFFEATGHELRIMDIPGVEENG